MSEHLQYWVVQLFDLSAKSVLLAILAAAAVWLFRIRNGNVCHRIWTGVLLGMTLLPLLVYITPGVPLPAWVVPHMPAVVSNTDLSQGEGQEQADAFLVETKTGSSDVPEFGNSRVGSLATSASWQPDPREAAPAEAFGPVHAPGTATTLLKPAEPASVAGGREVPVPSRAGLIWPVLLAVIYAAGFALFLWRLALGVWTAQRLVRNARTLPADLGNQRGAGDAVVLESEAIRVPITVGCFRPRILLPADWSSWSGSMLAAVLTHERTHIARWDHLVTILAEWNRCVYWFHPVAWYVRRKLAALAEQSCDDAVIRSTGDRTRYARYLLAVASRLTGTTGRLTPVGISIARKPNVELRIDSILDTKRPLARRIGLVGSLLLFLAVTPAVLLSAALRASSQSQPESESVATAQRPTGDDPTSSVQEATRIAARVNDGDISNGAGTEIRGEEEGQPNDAAIATRGDGRSEFAGQVVTPDGRPAAGAKIFMVYHVPEPTEPLVPSWKPVAVADQAGNFRFALGKGDYGQHSSEREWRAAAIVAVSEGHGFAWSMSAFYEQSGKALAEMRTRFGELPPPFREQVEKMLAQAEGPLRLVPDDEPIRGRVVDINGQPVAGAKFTPLRVWSGEEEDLTAWLEATKAERADFYSARQATPKSINGPQVRSLVTPAVTDADGRFQLRGIGRERIVQLLVERPGIESSIVYARTRAGEKIELVKEWRSPNLGKYVYHPAELVHVAGPTKPITGTVRDKDTGQPLAGVTIKSQKRHGNAISGWGQDFVRTVTDQQGRYRLDGMPIGSENRIAAIVPDGQAYLPISRPANTEVTEPSVQVDFDLKRAVWIEGRVTEKATGAPLPGRVRYFVFKDNPHLEALGRLGAVDLRDRYQANDDGRFRIPGLPGRGIVAFTAFDHQRFPRGAGAEKIQGADQRLGLLSFPTRPSICVANNFHMLAEVNPAEDADRVQINLTLDAGGTITGRVVDPDGKLLHDVYYSGRLAEYASWGPAKGDSFDVVGYDPEKPRRIVFCDLQRNFAGSLVLSGKPPEKLVVKLQRAGRVTGRLVDDDGAPLPHLMLVPGRPAVANPGARRQPDPGPRPSIIPLPPNVRNQAQYITDAEGRFRIEGLSPGLEYRLQAFDRASMIPQQIRMPRISGPLDKTFTVQPGQAIDLGDLRIVDRRQAAPAAPAPAEQVVGRKPASDQMTRVQATPLRILMREKRPVTARSPAFRRNRGTENRINAELRTIKTVNGVGVRGRVVNAAGEPIRGAAIFTHRFLNKEPMTVRDVELVERTRAGKDGGFDIRVHPSDLPERVDKLQLIAFAEGLGVGTASVPRQGDIPEVIIKLLADQPVRGRVFDTEGQPIAGVHLQATIIMQPEEGQLDQFLTGWTKSWRDATSRLQSRLHVVGTDRFCSATTNREGRFEIKGLGRERVAWLQLSGAGIAQTVLFVVTRAGVDVDSINDAALRRIPAPLRRPGNPLRLVGPTFDFIAEPGKTIEGTVSELDGGRPVAGLHVFSVVGWDSAVTGTTDPQGHFRLTGLPKVNSYGIHVRPAKGSALFAHTEQVPDNGELTHPQVEIKLPRGVIVTGQVIDRQTGEGVPSGLRFAPLPGNKYFEKPGYDGYRRNRMTESTDSEGRFRLVSIPGPVVLMAQTHSTELRIGDRPVKPFKQAEFSPEDRARVEVTQDDENRYFTGAGNSIESLRIQNAVKFLDLPDQQETVQCNLYVDRGRQRRLELQDADGKPLSGVIVAGLTDCWPITYQLEDSRCTVQGLDPARPRQLVFYHRQRRLAGSVRLSGEDSQPVVQRLTPAIRILGRAVDAEGQPVARAGIEKWFVDGAAQELERHLKQSREPLKTDDEGRFELDEVVPGFAFRLALRSGRSQQISQRISHTPEEAKNNVIDLGDVVVARR